jgi:hypothetical protein
MLFPDINDVSKCLNSIIRYSRIVIFSHNRSYSTVAKPPQIIEKAFQTENMNRLWTCSYKQDLFSIQ